MSPQSQTQPRSQARAPLRLGFGPRFALAMAAALVVGVALGPLWGPIVRAVGRAQPHGPDMAIFAGLSPAIKIHLFAALAALALGAVLMALRKGRRFHRVAGWAWVALVAVTAGSTLFITSLTPGRWSLLHLLTGWVLVILPLAVIAARRHAVAQHRRRMMGLFYGGFAINLFVALIPGRTLWAMFLG